MEGTPHAKSGGAAFNFCSLKAHEGTEPRCKEGANYTSVTGGGSATDLVKVTVHGSVHDGDARDPPDGKVEVKVRHFTGAASMTFVVGSETSNGRATINEAGLRK